MSLDLTLTPAVKMRCRGCQACCVDLEVEVDAEDESRWEEAGIFDDLFEKTRLDPVDPRIRILKMRDDETCVFLINGFCTIYELRPNDCRNFEYQGSYCKIIRTQVGLEEEEI